MKRNNQIESLIIERKDKHLGTLGIESVIHLPEGSPYEVDTRNVEDGVKKATREIKEDKSNPAVTAFEELGLRGSN